LKTRPGSVPQKGLYKLPMAAKKHAEIPAPRISEPDEAGSGRIIVTMGGKRYVMEIKVTATEIPTAPGIVIEMPKPE
jgi:hypothetical protein